MQILLLEKNLTWFSSMSYATGVLFLTILCIRYLYALVRGDEILGFKSDIMFWVASGLLIFYLGSLPYYGIPNEISRKIGEFLNLFWMVPIVLGCLMYILFALGFIWKKPR